MPGDWIQNGTGLSGARNKAYMVGFLYKIPYLKHLITATGNTGLSSGCAREGSVTMVGIEKTMLFLWLPNSLHL